MIIGSLFLNSALAISKTCHYINVCFYYINVFMFYNYSDIFGIIKCQHCAGWCSCLDCVDFTFQHWIHHMLITGNYWYTRLETAENNSESTRERICHFVREIWSRFPRMTVGFSVSIHTGLALWGSGAVPGISHPEVREVILDKYIFHQAISAGMNVPRYTPVMNRLFPFYPSLQGVFLPSLQMGNWM